MVGREVLHSEMGNINGELSGLHQTAALIP
jgi:hypothetical protein